MPEYKKIGKIIAGYVPRVMCRPDWKGYFFIGTWFPEHMDAMAKNELPGRAAYGEICRKIIDEVRQQNVADQAGFNRIKMSLVKRAGLKSIPRNIDIASFATNDERQELKELLTIKPTRTISGVATIAIMPRPIACRHGKCSYCPGGPGSVFGSVPQAYTGKEPATRRAIRNSYDPYLQTSNRVEQYLAMNKVPDKIEMIIMGGTYTSFPIGYQEEFIKYSYKALNDLSDKFFEGPGNEYMDLEKFNEFFKLPGNLADENRTTAIQEQLLLLKNSPADVGLESEQLRNEKAKMRLVALCFETRPDWANEPQIDMMLKLGATRVEIGVQTVYSEVLDRIKRMHTVEDSISATRKLKDSFLKVGYHMMPGLPGVTLEQDLESLGQIVKNPDFMPDAIKIYPCMVMRGTPLFEQWKKGEYLPPTTEQSAEIIAEFKRDVPEWLRIMRVQRDIPTFMTESGVDRTNLRQYVERKMEEKNVKCRCARCREPRSKEISWDNVEIKKQEYDSSCGKELFISCEDTKNDLLIGFARMRKPGMPHRPEIDGNTLGIRELHVYGPAVNLQKKDKAAAQHRGIGKSLLAEAERLAAEDYDGKKMLVISGVGVREYYKRLGYEREGPYMAKKLI